MSSFTVVALSSLFLVANAREGSGLSFSEVAAAVAAQPYQDLEANAQAPKQECTDCAPDLLCVDGVCQVCVNELPDLLCDQRALKGDCAYRPQFMLDNCKLSCNICGEFICAGCSGCMFRGVCYEKEVIPAVQCARVGGVNCEAEQCRNCNGCTLSGNCFEYSTNVTPEQCVLRGGKDCTSACVNGKWRMKGIGGPYDDTVWKWVDIPDFLREHSLEWVKEGQTRWSGRTVLAPINPITMYNDCCAKLPAFEGSPVVYCVSTCPMATQMANVLEAGGVAVVAIMSAQGFLSNDADAIPIVTTDSSTALNFLDSTETIIEYCSLGDCSDTCLEEWVSDGKCDKGCFNPACSFDNFDCEWAAACFDNVCPEGSQCYPFRTSQQQISYTCTPCPTGSVMPSERTINGQPAAAFSYPWYATFNPEVGCAGVLIAPNAVLTSAFCNLEAAVYVDFLNSFGSDLDSLNKCTRRQRVQSFEKHIGEDAGNPFAILFLGEDVNYVTPLEISRAPGLGGGQFYALGRGDRSPNGPPTNYLTQIFQTHNTEQCNARNSWNFCASSPSQTQALCYGDSAAPLISPVGGQFILYGMAGLVTQCPYSVVQYSAVAAFADWIDRTVKQSKCPACGIGSILDKSSDECECLDCCSSAYAALLCKEGTNFNEIQALQQCEDKQGYVCASEEEACCVEGPANPSQCVDVRDCVCQKDDFCCLEKWDKQCATMAIESCNLRCFGSLPHTPFFSIDPLDSLDM